jgi:Xaa-Pro aminopeptidase
MARKKQAKKPPTPPRFKHRLQTLQQRLRATKAQALLVTNPHDIHYLTGFTGEDSWALVPERGSRVTIFSDFRFQEQIQRQAPHATAIIRKKGLVAELRQRVQQRGYEKLALQPEYVTLSVRHALKKELGASTLIEIDDGLLHQRSVKDAEEIRTIQQALIIQQKAFEQTLDILEPGLTEIEIAGYLEYCMRCLGAEGTSFPTIVAVDANAALPHYMPGQSKLKRGSTLLIDWGATYHGYCSDLTRVVALGSMKPKMRAIYDIVREAQHAAIGAIAPGASLKAVDAIARQHIKQAGYGKQFGHGLGHGIGLDVHELPTLSPRSSDVLRPGQVVTVEPGIYLPGVGGVRIEDDVAVTDEGAKVLSDLPNSRSSAII